MKNILYCLWAGVVLMLFSTAALAQIQRPASVKVKNKYKNLDASVAQTISNYEFQLKNKTYYADANVKKACEAIKSCASWARQKFTENPSLHIYKYGARHGILIEKDSSTNFKDESYFNWIDVEFHYSASGKVRVKTFRIKNVRLSDKKRCINCDSYFSSHMSTALGSHR